jgi:hypothetical protein
MQILALFQGTRWQEVSAMAQSTPGQICFKEQSGQSAHQNILLQPSSMPWNA